MVTDRSITMINRPPLSQLPQHPSGAEGQRGLLYAVDDEASDALYPS